ncbi:hypothetical protein Y032_0016g2927 [Ancylostoma ceylanicum]|uniref:Uncharacterized protein n=1 Tax=Ancylostoma ceylanicum TaxID=53326 RepID=A0A016V7P8_9BILA|nr:hypothetical protein Y032_0016g2927 [Ancylostoma ceylanicum]
MVRLGQVVWEATEYGPDDGGWVRLAAALRKTPEYRSTLARQVRERQHSDPPWPSSSGSTGVQVCLGQAVIGTSGYVRVLLCEAMVETPAYGSSLAKQ